ncbi:MAG: ABC transporter permease [Kiritimatiellia bacterium]
MKGVAQLIWWRDLRSALLGLSSYGMLAGFLVLTGWSFVELLRRNEGGFASAQTIWAMAMAPWLPALAVVASMRLFAEERQTGTIETLLTAPVRAQDIVLGKFFAALSLVAAGIFLALLQVFVLRHVAPRLDGEFSSAGLVSATALLVLQAAAWTAIGTFASLLARQQAAAGVLTVLCIGAPYAIHAVVLAWVPRMRHSFWQWPPMGDVADAATGLFALAPLVLYLSVTWCVLFICVRLLEARDLGTR